METPLFVWFGGILGGNVGAFMSNSRLPNKNVGFTTESHLYFCVNYTFLQPKTICTTSRPNVIYQLAHYMKISHNFDNHHYPYNSKQSSSSVSWPFPSLQSVCWCLRTLKGSFHSLFCFTFFVISWWCWWRWCIHPKQKRWWSLVFNLPIWKSKLS